MSDSIHRSTSGRSLGGRMCAYLAELRDEPNPLWLREMRQAARVQLTPIALAALTILMTLFIGGIGGMMAAFKLSPASIGGVLFQTFFTLAYFIVAVVGPALGANTIASEREGRTWEVVLLTGMRPATIARGKFASAYTSIAIYIVALAPVGALPFIFGGVTPTEVVVAFLVLFVFALLSVAFGLALSARMQSLRGAIVVTLLAAFPLASGLFAVVGPMASTLAHRVWPGVQEGTPFWYPVAWGVAPFGREFLLFLVAIPLAVVGLPAWFLFEVTLANLSSITEDRSFGLKRWHLVAAPVTLALLLVLSGYVDSLAPSELHAVVSFGFVAYAVFVIYLFATEVFGPSRRVLVDLAGRGFLRQRLAPGLAPTRRMLRLTLTLPLILVTLGWMLATPSSGLPTTRAGAHFVPTVELTQIALVGVFLAAYVEFLIGLTTFLRVRSAGGSGVRPLLILALFVTAVGPWIVGAVAGLLSSRSDPGVVVAAPSPVFLLLVTHDALVTGGALSSPLVACPLVFALLYAAGGVWLGRRATERCRAAIDQHTALLADADRRLAEEDAALERDRATNVAPHADMALRAEVDAPTEAPPSPESVADSIADVDVPPEA